MRKLARIAGTLLLAAGVLTLVWVIVVWRWQDPFTAIYTHFEQSRLSHEYTQRARRFDAQVADRDLSAEAAAYRRTLQRGDPVGRLQISRIGLDMVVVQGTDESSLRKGPGHYIPSALPGQGRLVYVAGHRTTYLAPFAQINDLRLGDCDPLRPPVRHVHLSRDAPLRRAGLGRRGAPQPRTRAPSPTGVPPAVLRHPSLHRRCAARPGRTDYNASQLTCAPWASSPSPRGTSTSAFALAAAAIMCDSWPRGGCKLTVDADVRGSARRDRRPRRTGAPSTPGR